MKTRNPELLDMIYEYVQKFIMKNKRIPSTSEIGAELGISKTTAYRYLMDLDQQGRISYNGKNRTIASDSISKYDTSSIQAAILGSIHCGEPQFEEENIESYVNLPSQIFGRDDCYILHANGESMIDAGIDDGDYVVIRKQWFARDGDIVVALVDGESTLKIYRKDENGVVYLQAANKKEPYLYPDIYAHNSLYIQGVAIFIIKDIGSFHSV